MRANPEKQFPSNVGICAAILVVLITTVTQWHRPPHPDHDMTDGTALIERGLAAEQQASHAHRHQQTSNPKASKVIRETTQQSPPCRNITEFNQRFHSTVADQNPRELRALLDEYRRILERVHGAPSPEEYNAACYYGSVLEALASHGALSSDDVTNWITFIEERVRNNTLDEEFRSALLWSGQNAGVQDAIRRLAREMLVQPETTTDSHMARRSAGILMRSGRQEDRTIALRYAVIKKQGGAVESIVGFLADENTDQSACTLSQLRTSGVKSPLYRLMNSYTIKDISAIIASGNDPDIDGALALVAEAVFQDCDKALCVDVLCNLISDADQPATARKGALSTLLQMTEHMGLETGRETLGRIRGIVDFDQVLADWKAGIAEICDGKIVK